MNNIYKGYHTNIEIDFDNHSLYGKIEGINDLVNFESDTIAWIEKEFHDAVDDYLDFCGVVGKMPEIEERIAKYA